MRFNAGIPQGIGVYSVNKAWYRKPEFKAAYRASSRMLMLLTFPSQEMVMGEPVPKLGWLWMFSYSISLVFAPDAKTVQEMSVPCFA
jgi:hypothetical protein